MTVEKLRKAAEDYIEARGGMPKERHETHCKFYDALTLCAAILKAKGAQDGSI